MGFIQKLDQSTILKLAAGEIIDRPVSIVKELVENAIDSGATMINVHTTQGGIAEIRVEDNGCGIANDDIQLTIEVKNSYKNYYLSTVHHYSSNTLRQHYVQLIG